MVVGSIFVLIPWFATCAVLARRGRDLARAQDRAVVIGSQEDSLELVHQLDDHSERPGRVVAVIDPADAVPRPGRPAPVRAVVEEHDATVERAAPDLTPPTSVRSTGSATAASSG